MGYYTAFNITIEKMENSAVIDKEKLATELHKINDGFPYSEGDTIEDMIEYEMIKWYDCEEDMLELSRKFPNLHFIIEGWGEEREDFWQEHFVNGKCQYCPGKVVYPEFNPDLLR